MNYKPTKRLNHENDVLKSEYSKVSLAYFDILGFSHFLKEQCEFSPKDMMQIFYETLT